MVIVFSRRFTQALRARSFKSKPLSPREHRLTYASGLFFYGIATPLTALAAAELLIYAITGQTMGMINIGGRPLGEPP